ncbi:MAG TPA: TadE family protein [Vicinamibacterales bacterium]|nr:TadE family protein [Vicinamibacterales bacterium]
MKRIRSEKGAALIEAAITVPIILLISVGIFEFGRAYQTQQVLVNAAREGARLAVIEGSTDAQVRARVNDYLSLAGLKTLGDDKIPINRTTAVTGTGTTGSSVEVLYPFEFMVLNPVVKLIAPTDTKTGAPITMKAATVMRNE